jgi:hypothetical protein
MADSKSRLHQLALRIEREQIRVQYPDIPAWAWRVARSASRYAACAEMMLDLVGSDPNATPRKASALERAAEMQLKKLQRLIDDAKGYRRQGAVSLAEIRQRYANGHSADELIVTVKGQRAESR